MKYCIDFQKGFRYINDVDEITIIYRRKDTSLIDFLLEHQKQRINIYIKDEEDFLEYNCIKIFDAIAKEHPEIDFCFKLKKYTDSTKDIFSTILNSEVKHKYFFEDFVHDWDTLWGYINLKPSSIYIAEELGFEIKAVAELLHSFSIEVRCFPNVAQSSWTKTSGLKKFFIRPEDTVWYEPYVDVYEFFGKPDSLETYYKIYAIDKKWFGKLNEVILSFDGEIDSRFLIPSFAERRLNCGKRCLKGRGCRICEATEQLSATLEKHNLMFTDFDKE